MSLPKPSVFMESIIAFLLPYFTVAVPDMEAARAEIMETLAEYAIRTRGEMLQAAQVIALGMTTLDTLAEAKAADLPPAMRIRYRGCANSLNRATLQTQKALDKQLASDPPPASEPMPEPANDLPDDQVQGAIQHAQAKIAQYRLDTARPTEPQQNQQLWAGAMMDALKQMGVPGLPDPGT